MSAEGAADAFVARSSLGDEAAAIVDVTRALELDPGDASAHSFRGIFRAELGDWQGAVEDCDRSLALWPGSKDVRALRAAALARLGRAGD